MAETLIRTAALLDQRTVVITDRQETNRMKGETISSQSTIAFEIHSEAGSVLEAIVLLIA